MMEQCKEKLNIAMFGQKRIPSREGGVEIVVKELCTRMVAQGHNKKLVIAGGSSDTDSFMNELKDLAKDDDRIIFTGFVQGADIERTI